MTLGDCRSPLLELLDRRWLSAQLISRFRPLGVACLRRLSELEGGGTITLSGWAGENIGSAKGGELWCTESTGLCWGEGVLILAGGEAVGEVTPRGDRMLAGSLFTEVATGDDNDLVQSFWWDWSNFSHVSLCCLSSVICSSNVAVDFSSCSICCNRWKNCADRESKELFTIVQNGSKRNKYGKSSTAPKVWLLYKLK